MERLRKGGLEEIIKSWIGTGPNKPISPNQLHHALGPETVDGLTRETGMPREVAELETEILTLQRLETQARAVRLSGTDTKWKQLNEILDHL